MATLTLFGERNLDSPFVFTVFVALKEKGVPFTLRLLDLSRGEQREPGFVERSLTARVPTLAAGDFSISESLAIVEYLDETFAPPRHARLLPEAVEERARARQVLGWLRSDLAALRRERPTSSIFFPRERATAPLSDAARADAEKLVRITSTLLDGRASPFDGWSIAEADLAMALMRLVANDDPVPGPVRDYVETQWRRPSVAAWVALGRPATDEAISA
ncbi:MAG TPA: glutathione transferase [Polyangiaceae bacterium]|nr:glutathione transferase [Polyangiaceae bacterium]